MSDGWTREPWEWGPTYAQQLRDQTRRLDSMYGTIPLQPPNAPSLTEADVRRIVREEIEASRPVPSVLAVTPDDVKRWMK